jgi:hypothetical protein
MSPEIPVQGENKTKWFNDLIDTIKSHQLMIESGVASKEIKSIYEPFINSDFDEIHKNARKMSSKYFIQKLVIEYINEVTERMQGSNPNKLALQLSDSQILVWSEIKDDDENAEDSLLLAEAKINAMFGDVGFHISSTILEESDNYPIPEQFSRVF